MTEWKFKGEEPRLDMHGIEYSVRVYIDESSNRTFEIDRELGPVNDRVLLSSMEAE